MSRCSWTVELVWASSFSWISTE